MNLISLIPGGIINLVAFVAFYIPLVGYIFRKHKYNLIELGLLSLVLSIMASPVIAWLLNFLISFSMLLIAIIFLIPLSISAYLIIAGKFKLQEYHFNFSKSSIVVLLIFLASFYLHVQSLSSYFYEFDPYYYMMIPEFLITQGSVPMHDDLAYASNEVIHHNGQDYQLRLINHRVLPVPQYLTAIWYSLALGFNYNHLYNAVISNVYPPLLIGLVAFLVYMLFKDEYSNWLAVAAAFAVAFMPALFTKFLAGVAEQLPWGIYAAVAGIAFIYFAVKHKNDRIYYIPAIIAVLGAVLGSKAGMMPVVIGSAYIAILAAHDFLHNKRDKFYYEFPAVLAVFTYASNLLFDLYMRGSAGLMPNAMTIVILLASAFSFFTYHLLDRGKSHLTTMKKRAYALCGIGLIGALFLATPLGHPVLNYLGYLSGVGQLSTTSALQKTVAEENLYSSYLQNRFGYVGISLDVSKITSKFISKYGSLAAVPLIYLLLVLSFVSSILRRKFSLTLLLFIFIVSVSWIGLQKIKYTPHLGLVLALALACVASEAYESAKSKDSKGWQRHLGYYAGVILLVIAGYAALSYSWGFITYFIGDGSIPFFATSNPAYYVLFAIVLAVVLYYSHEWYREGKLDRVFAMSMVVLLLPFALNNITVIPHSISYASINITDHASVVKFCSDVRSSGSAYLSVIYCNVIPNYWYDAMEWLRDNVNDDSYVISWWDYGHWTNYFGRQRTVTRNDHPFVILDLEVADKFVANTPEALKEYMDSRNSTYALFDMDLIGKWGALTYLSCVYNNETSPTEMPYESECSASYQFERIYVPNNPTINEMCVLDQFSQTYGKLSFSIYNGRVLGTYCVLEQDRMLFVFDAQTGKQLSVIPLKVGDRTFDGRRYSEFLMVYTNDSIDDAPLKGYDSVFYKAFFLGQLDGFEQVYPEDVKGLGVLPIRIYRKI